MVIPIGFECINQNQMKKNKTNQLNDAPMKKHLPNIETTHFFNLFNIKNISFIKLIFFFLLLAAAQKAAAQSGNVNITIVDEYNKPIAGVSVSSVSNTEKTGVTDIEGNLTLEIEPSGYLKVSHHTIEKMVAIKSNSIRIQLQKTDSKINVGYSIAKNSDEITTALDLVYSDKLQKSSLNNPTESLYGKLKGLTVLQNGGEPWSRDPSLFIRGIGTTGNNRILVLVDGFERDLSSLSLLDIENVSVLKDGTDVAKYGLRGANGVLLVTTKRGKSNSFHVDVSYDRGMNMAFRKPKFLNSFDYANAVNQANVLDGNQPIYSDLDLDNFKNQDSPLSHPNVDWWDETMKDYGETNNLNTSFYGGGKSINYYSSLNYQNERGLIDNTDLDSRYDSSMKYDRLNFRTNLDIQLTKSTKFIVDASGYIGGQNQPSAGRDSNNALRLTPFIINSIYSIPSAAIPVRTSSGEWGGTQNYPNNPVALASSTGIATLNYRTLYTNGKIIQDLNSVVKGLSAEVAIAYDNYASIFENRTRSYLYETVPFTRDANGAIVFGTPQQFGTDSALAYSDGFGDQVRQATGIGKINYENSWSQNKFYASFLYQEDKRVNDNQYNTFARQNFMTSASYSYKNRYFLDGVVSYSGTNVLPEDNRFGFFPAVSAGWIVNRENFLKNSKSINYLKLRGSWGMSGNDIMTQNLDEQAFDAGGTYYWGINNNSSAGIREGRLAAQGLTFESSEKLNLGFNLELFNQLTFSFDAFQDKRTNIIVGTGGVVPSILGVTPAAENAGEVLNRGIEGSFQWKNQVDKLKYFVSGNFIYSKNEIININEEIRPFDYLRQTGQSIGQRFGLESVGFFQNQTDIDASPKQLFSQVRPGDVKYKDQNGDNVINAFDEVAIGYSGSNPELNYAINFGVEMNGFGLDILLQGIANQTLYLTTKSTFWPLVGQNTISTFSSGAWTPETAATATLPRLTNVNNDNNYRPNDIWLQSGNYLKMRHFEFYYNLPESVTKTMKMTRAKLYARGMNVFSIDNINIVDPESTGIEYPTLASYHLGIKIEF
jgi:TonB-linked SusC/RagA family outer membrane protein